MKCEECRKRMKTVMGNTRIKAGDKSIEILNIPVLVCPDCGKRVIHDTSIKRAKNYIQQYGTQNDSIDFSVCEEKENEDAMVVMQMLGMF